MRTWRQRVGYGAVMCVLLACNPAGGGQEAGGGGGGVGGADGITPDSFAGCVPGSPPETLLTGLNCSYGMSGLAVKDGYVYFNLDGVLSRIPRGGGAVQPVMPHVADHVDAAPYLLISRFNQDPACELCSDIVLYDAVSDDEQVIATGLRNVAHLARTDAAIYVGHGVEQPDGSWLRVLDRFADGSTVRLPVDAANLHGIAASNEALFFVSWDPMSQWRLRRLDLASMQVGDVAESWKSSAVLVHDELVYWTAPDRTLARVSVTGGQPESMGDAAARGFASSEEGLVYLVDTNDFFEGRIASSEANGSVATLVEAGPSPSLAVDDSCVYYVEVGVDCEFAEIERASLMRAPR
ncbi:MAG: hypothetical protein HOW73_02740 [Polyangiaceae bacterium]|nr:hypothetical protein [Polyangiaceae bacterium]